MSKKVQFFDTTLRDGEQSPGIALNIREKLEIAEQLARLNVDVIEAGFPIASQGDCEAVEAIAKKIKGPVITGLARTDDEDIDRAWEAIREAERPRIHTFVSTSDIHMKHQLKKNKREVLAMAKRAVRRAKRCCADVEFSAMDATRSDPKFLCRIFETAVAEGATVINIPDTVGYALPHEFAALVKDLIKGTPGMKKIIVSVHCHNDLGLAVANSMAAVGIGARQVECAVNGLGERTGTARLEAVVMALRTRREALGLDTQLDTQVLYPLSQLVSHLTGLPIPPNKAIVGDNAFAYTSGMYQEGALRGQTEAERIDPAAIGVLETKDSVPLLTGREAADG